MIPFWQITNQYNVNKERENKSLHLNLHNEMQGKAEVKHASLV